MKRPSGHFLVIYANDALRDLEDIADWNEQTYGPSHARDYIQLLQRHIETLANDPARGRPVSARPDLRHVRIQKRSKAHGHVAVYTFDDRAVTVVHVFHTSQDWENRLAEKQE